MSVAREDSVGEPRFGIAPAKDKIGLPLPLQQLDGELDRLIERKLRRLGLIVQDSWMTPTEAASHARLSKTHFLRLRRFGQGPTSVGQGKFLRFRKSAVDTWVAGISEGHAKQLATIGG